MSYSRTVYCSYCGVKGHNRRGCEPRKEYIANNPDSYQARREAIAAEHRKNRPRTCSYCLESGHNARTCGVKAKDKRTLTQKLENNRATVMNLMMKKGFGIGALVEIPGRYQHNDCYLLTGVDWERTDDVEKISFEIAYVNNGRRFTHSASLLQEPTGYNSVKVLSPADVSSIQASFPRDWKLGTLYDVQHYFPKGEGRRYWAFDEE